MSVSHLDNLSQFNDNPTIAHDGVRVIVRIGAVKAKEKEKERGRKGRKGRKGREKGERGWEKVKVREKDRKRHLGRVHDVLLKVVMLIVTVGVMIRERK